VVPDTTLYLILARESLRSFLLIVLDCCNWDYQFYIDIDAGIVRLYYSIIQHSVLQE